MRDYLAQKGEQLQNFLMNVSIRTKILGIVFLMVVIPGSIVTFQIRDTLLNVFRERLQEQGLSIAHHLASTSTPLILTQNIYTLNKILDQTVEDYSDVRYIFIEDTNSRIIAHTFETGFPSGLLNINQLSPGEPYRVQIFLTEEGRIWDVAVPIFEGKLGVLHVGLQETGLGQIVNTVTSQILLDTLVAFILGIVAAFVLTWILTRPILALQQATENVARGDYSQSLPVWADDEIGALIKAFNSMVQQLAAAEQERAEREQMRQFYLQRIIHAQEEERKRVARELHDELGQALAAFMVNLRMIEESLSTPEARASLDTLRINVAETLERARRLAFELRPSVLDDLGLVPALERYIQQYQQTFSIITELQVIGLNGRRFAPEIETTVYRIIQEALSNAAKYADCTHISVLLHAKENKLSIIVEDNGRGFDVEHFLPNKKSTIALGCTACKNVRI